MTFHENHEQAQRELGLLPDDATTATDQEREDAARIKEALRAIVDCYGVGVRDPLRALRQLSFYILEAKELLDEINAR